MPDGRIEPRQVERLREMGQWLGQYGESIYGTRGGPFKTTAQPRQHVQRQRRLRAHPRLVRRHDHPAGPAEEDHGFVPPDRRERQRAPDAGRHRDHRAAAEPPGDRHDRQTDARRPGRRDRAGGDVFRVAGRRQEGDGVERVPEQFGARSRPRPSTTTRAPAGRRMPASSRPGWRWTWASP